MSDQFARILFGLMQNRRLSARTVSRASGRAESTINQLLAGRLAPNAEILADIAPVLELSLDDLRVIAGVQELPEENRIKPYEPMMEIGQLVAAASHLTPEQVGDLVEAARSLRPATPS